ncbi:MAG: chromosome segregation protein SMC, partial [Planctomycetota bacterium]|nr:chromosome segregation protein SMC [Planctomycetota bacterium]
VDAEFEQMSQQMEIDDQSLQAVVMERTAQVEQIERLQREVAQAQAKQNELKLLLATEEKNREKVESSLEQIGHSLADTAGQKVQIQQEIESNQERISESGEKIESAKNELVVLVEERDELTARVMNHSDERKQVVDRRDLLQQSNSELSGNIKQWQNRKHKIELELGQIGNLQAALQERLRDDYGLELREISEANIEFVIEDRDEAEEEVESLRKKITGIGAVNTDALKELEDLEDRYLSLEEQFQDLVKAKESLERIIIRINTDSRKIFVETLEAIRKNFQTLYRRNFGGGKADLVLEEGVDELEAGIDIVATPPGKAEFSNSLLSGGEKALTAVSLLLAIFQFRPSPFCVLDEVDAPFDEANIGRFVEVLKGFLSWTRFVVVTHSKKTMTAADTLYGVTMLESGISTKVSVRFEDVDEKGNISQEAVAKSEASQSSSGKGVA